ncbi:MAG: hypothetical protein BWK72_18235 [Rhodoferax ferrireducens]|uniref:BrnA antitoxin family protein n=1 Tax=Rhodoferax ferrireducens TaxID=192843 RepID=A0A1W9KPU0_9BURK|nr:MAG: hypothetical protein BWK72_18235 [Rhodoferax ferrireducens]
MQTHLTLRDGRKILLNTPEEEAQINTSIAADPDTHEVSDAEFALMRRKPGRPAAAVVRPMLSIRVDPDVAAALRASGKGWQTRVNALLRQAVEQGRLQA